MNDAPSPVRQSSKTLKVGLAVSLALHLAAVGLYYLPFPNLPQEPEPEEVVQVEMVPEPEPEPEPEPAPEPEQPAEQAEEQPAPPEPPPEPAPEEQPAPEPPQPTPSAETMPPVPVEEPVMPEQAMQRPPSEMQVPDKPPPQVESDSFDMTAQEGQSEDGGDPAADAQSSEPGQQPEATQTPSDTAEAQDQPPVEQSEEDAAGEEQSAKPPELDLPETAMRLDPMSEGEALIERVPTPSPRPQQGADSGAQAASATGGGRQAPQLRKVAQIYANKAIANPAMRDALMRMPRERRIVQMCMIETLEQIRHARPSNIPQGLFFDPRSGSPISGRLMTAEGAAYKYSGGWRDVDFRCSVNADADAITDFSFIIGGDVPTSQWRDRRFPGSR